jgi:hypothetical protein
MKENGEPNYAGWIVASIVAIGGELRHGATKGK